MRVVLASSEALAGGIARELVNLGHQLLGVVVPREGLLVSRFKWPRFPLHRLKRRNLARASRQLHVPLRVSPLRHDGAAMAWLKRERPDLLLVLSWPVLIPAEILNQFTYGGLNIHPSLLPLLRGADPIFSLLAQGGDTLGLTFHKMTEHLDEGPIVYQTRQPIMGGEAYDEVYLRFLQLAETSLERAFLALKTCPEGVPQCGPGSVALRFQRAMRWLDCSADAKSVIHMARACHSHHSMKARLVHGVLRFSRGILVESASSAPVPFGYIRHVGWWDLELRIGNHWVRLCGVRPCGLMSFLQGPLLRLLVQPGSRVLPPKQKEG